MPGRRYLAGSALFEKYTQLMMMSRTAITPMMIRELTAHAAMIP